MITKKKKKGKKKRPDRLHVSLGELYENAKTLTAMRHLDDLNAYVRMLIRKDIEENL